MKITFPARYCANYRLVANESVEIVEATLRKLKWKHSLTADNKFLVQIPFNVWSFGEKMTVEVQNEEISICSECLFPFQGFDWGKNKRNVKIFLDNLEEVKESLLSNKSLEKVKPFDDAGLSPIERAFAEINNS